MSNNYIDSSTRSAIVVLDQIYSILAKLEFGFPNPDFICGELKCELKADRFEDKEKSVISAIIELIEHINKKQTDVN